MHKIVTTDFLVTYTIVAARGKGYEKVNELHKSVGVKSADRTKTTIGDRRIRDDDVNADVSCRYENAGTVNRKERFDTTRKSLNRCRTN